MAAIAGLVVVACVYGIDAALLLGGAFVVLLGGLYLFQVATAHQGMDTLEDHRSKFGFEVLTEASRERVSDSDAVRFAVFGDSRNNRKAAELVYGAAAAKDPHLMFHTGDIVRHGTPKEFARNHLPLVEALAPIPMFCVPGNHDRGPRRDFAAFKAIYGGTRFAFEVGPCGFVGFNNSGKERVTEEHLAFLEKELSSMSAPHKYVFFHIPPAFFEDTFVNDDKRRGFTKNAPEMHELFRRYAVEEVFMAHIHGYASSDIDGVRYTLTAGAGAPLSSRVKSEDSVLHYVLIEADNAAVTREVVRLTE